MNVFEGIKVLQGKLAAHVQVDGIDSAHVIDVKDDSTLADGKYVVANVRVVVPITDCE